METQEKVLSFYMPLRFPKISIMFSSMYIDKVKQQQNYLYHQLPQMGRKLYGRACYQKFLKGLGNKDIPLYRNPPLKKEAEGHTGKLP